MKSIQQVMKIGVLAAGALMLAQGVALAAEPQPAKEIEAAAKHAGFAAGAGDIDGVRTHLHHTVNCLVGPEGEGFAPKELNPCKALGNGAIPDTQDDVAKSALEAALEKAQSGLADENLETAKMSAMQTEAMLRAVQLDKVE
ncbi:hypothetical protein [Parvibaculum sp.]|jgi:hypothetical protein|uniref:hypothetical protein n=1 Tax=Parvibaculum sp. TaxID=2024848 RepID=UPI001AFCE600|nr:hypothetical protein [Parvibaculum sp.]MBO6666840.1 hypothetical protein [Parvibaculum sp.]MBO6691642.1 hypothetical protein [Parvibaculum sp.]MBO6713461.1 hypothetical protein [Parvibaculum sp.]|tara:strand:- start:631 stop:1056 length:426 start_codon:yes stop_codon:yes gene_type:complete